MTTFRSVLGMTALALAVTTGSAFAQDCKPAHTFKTVAPGKLTVAIYEYPPFSTITSDGKIGGVDTDIARKIAEENCLELTPAIVDAAATVQYVLSGKADLAAGDWYRTAERAKVLGLSYPTYLDQMGVYSKTGYSKVSDLVGKKVGSVAGFLWVADLQKLLGSNLKLYQNPVALAQDLQAGRIDIGIDSFGTGVYAQKKGGYPGIQIKVAEPDERVRASIQAAQVNLLHTKGNEGLTQALDDGIKKMHEDGTLKAILSAHGLDPSGADVGEPRVVQ
ncbi:transporter substrate-binding domain-containing protein [Ancylobacter sp. 6x-1]|uniref:Transporter substrate-binding domain-containing protein n=1 Tax=Ancylobacter crimeensis TaxID=2579147 RepID=A0ABT0DB85_9HYPH|nr:transporter substrate-binding domain-containing protein [Ancylobacter crimeensis]MCK0197212.1 transporter substrate-binding domain-containing protein [Ancylobacter crimeensis]